MEDTAWVLTPYSITRLFGSHWAQDGWLRGAIINGTTYGTLHPLPVELVSFTAEVSGNNVTLNWSTASEVNNKGFEIQRLQDYPNGTLRDKITRLQDWKVIRFVEGHGTTTETKFYSFTDENLPPGNYQYRLKQIDFDGTFEYSDIIEAEVLTPGKFALYQNYPNPFNPNTIIRFEIPGQARNDNILITLKVFDLLGREVATLIDEERPAGYYEIDFDASGLASGVYMYQLRAGHHIEVNKMVLTK
jgi:hypothetical protein